MATARQPIRIAFCITDLDPGGAERALVQLVTRLDRVRFEPHVFCLSPPGALVQQLEAASIPVVCLGARRRWHVHVVWKLYRHLRQLRPALLQTFLFHANLLGRIAARLAGVPHIVSGIRVAERRRKLYLTLDRFTERLIVRHVCVSRDVADFSRERGGLNPHKLVVIPNGVDVDRFASAQPLDLRPWNIQPDDQVWVMVGRLDPQKGPWDLIEAVHRLRPSHPRLRVLWAGDGPLRESMQEMLISRQLENVIRLIGWHENIPSLLKAAQGFVLFSHWEGMPNAVLEAQAAGIPVVTTKVEGIAEIIVNGQTGWFAEGAENLTKCWDEVLRMAPQDVARIATAGQQRVREHFSWDAMAQQYSKLYEELLSSK